MCADKQTFSVHRDTNTKAHENIIKLNCQDQFIRQPLSFSALIWPTNQPLHPQLSTNNISPSLWCFPPSFWSVDETLCPHSTAPPTPPTPPRSALFGTVSQMGKKSARCSVCSAHIIAQQSHSPNTSTSKKRLQIWLFLCFIRLRHLADGVLAFDFWFIRAPCQLQMELRSWQHLHESYQFH